MEKIRILELFGGIGACSKALERLGIDYEIADYVEIDKYAVRSFNAMHNTNFPIQDVTTWDKDIKVDLLMHGSPCQDFSLSGLQAGGDEGSGTRSSLMYETIRIVQKIKPKYVVWENVKNLLSKKHIHNFNNYLNKMSEIGYTNYYQVLNSKDYGIPQNRERVFTISILNIEFLGEQEDSFVPITDFKFPPKQELKLKLKDMLEDEVDEKYYLSEKMMNYVLDNNETQKGTKWEGRADNDTLNSTIAHTLSVRGAGGSQRAGVSNFIVDDCEDEIKVKDLKLKIKNATKKGVAVSNEIQMIEVPQNVKVRKYEVDVDKLKKVLKQHKNHANKEIALLLNVPLTTVEHWFRSDNCFSIPDADIWLKLKELLDIETDEFDKSIMTFEEREGVYEKSNRCYYEEGISPTITSTSANEKIIVSAARRKRENGQQIEVSNREYSNAITTIQTDALVCEKEGNDE